MSKWIMVVLSLAAAVGAFACKAADEDKRTDTGSDSDSDSDSDTDTDSDSDSDSSSDTESGSETGTDTECADNVASFIWIANTGEGTLSKVDTTCAIEVARYLTGPHGAANDPSRTSVNRHGDMVVTNRREMGPSSVTKFAGDLADCIDRNDNGSIETSTGPSDVLPWEKDECMLWNTKVGPPNGARATSWDGREDPETGKGGHVWVATCTWGMGQNKVFKLDGDTGEILEQTNAPGACLYGGAMDGRGAFWIVDNYAPDKIYRVDVKTLEIETHPAGLCGYGLSVDSTARIWTAGDLCVRRFDPRDDSVETVNVAGKCPGCSMLRGMAIGREKSLGFAWVADSSGFLIKIDVETVEIVETIPVGTPDVIGVAIDYEGYVWAVSQGASSAYKVDPETNLFITVPIGNAPYTYSDMTGVQLENVIAPQ